MVSGKSFLSLSLILACFGTSGFIMHGLSELLQAEEPQLTELRGADSDAVHTLNSKIPDAYSLSLEKDQSFGIDLAANLNAAVSIYASDGKLLASVRSDQIAPDKPRTFVRVEKAEKYRVEIQSLSDSSDVTYRVGFFELRVMVAGPGGQRHCEEGFELRIW